MTGQEQPPAAHKKACMKGVCDIVEYQSYKKENGASAFREVTVYSDVPCRVSFGNMGNVNAAQSTGVAVAIEQTIKLFINPDITIKAGSKIIVTQNGETVDYHNANPPMKYATHQEIILDYFKRWA